MGLIYILARNEPFWSFLMLLRKFLVLNMPNIKHIISPSGQTASYLGIVSLHHVPTDWLQAKTADRECKVLAGQSYKPFEQT